MTDHQWRGYQALARSVIAEACADLISATASQRDRASAEVFFAGGPDLDFWCMIAGLDPQHLTRRMTDPGTLFRLRLADREKRKKEGKK